MQVIKNGLQCEQNLGIILYRTEIYLMQQDSASWHFVLQKMLFPTQAHLFEVHFLIQ